VNSKDSRIPGFYRLSLANRQSLIASRLSMSLAQLQPLLETGGMTPEIANNTVENVIGTYALPLGVALNFCVNGVDRIVPMVVEEPSVIAAASNAARLVRLAGGFTARMLNTWMTGQVELRGVVNASESKDALEQAKAHLMAAGNSAVPNLVRRNGGVRDIAIRDLGLGTLVVHFHLECQDAMGANLVNTVAEALGAEIARIAKARLGLRILTNLCDQRRVQASCRIHVSDLADAKAVDAMAPQRKMSGEGVAQAVAEASHFAEIDPYRAATHNKGIMNGIDSVVVATGNDFRAAEAGAHAWAARDGQYRPLAHWHVDGEYLVGELEMPLALGTVGGTIRVHPIAQMALELTAVRSASDLSELAACVGLASNFSALRALATEGIQRGHMSLHARSVALAAGARTDEVDTVARALAASGAINEATARALLDELRSKAIERLP